GKVVGVVHYEKLVVDQIEQFLKQKLPPSRLEMFQHAEKILAEAVRFHETAREREQRSGPRWDELAQRLRGQLLVVKLDQLKEQASQGNAAAVAELSRQLAYIYPKNPEVRAGVIQVQLEQANRLLQGDRDEAYIQVRHNLEQLERLFPDTQENKLREL